MSSQVTARTHLPRLGLSEVDLLDVQPVGVRVARHLDDPPHAQVELAEIGGWLGAFGARLRLGLALLGRVLERLLLRLGCGRLRGQRLGRLDLFVQGAARRGSA
jgi:hypothetical protein